MDVSEERGIAPGTGSNYPTTNYRYAEPRRSSNNVYNRRDFSKIMAEWAEMEFVVCHAIALKFQNLRWRIEHLGYAVPVVVDGILSARNSVIYQTIPELAPLAPYRPGMGSLMEVRASAVNAAIAIHFASYIDFMLEHREEVNLFLWKILGFFINFIESFDL